MSGEPWDLIGPAAIEDAVSVGVELEAAQAFLESLKTHILYVREAGELVHVASRLLNNHDLSKFTTSEFPHYACRFFGANDDPDGWAGAWLHHIHHNPHHWQHWIFPDGFTPQGVEMPYDYILEMVADWMGACRAYTGSWDMQYWLWKNMPKIRVHSRTALFLREVLDYLGYADVVYIRRFASEEQDA